MNQHQYSAERTGIVNAIGSLKKQLEKLQSERIKSLNLSVGDLIRVPNRDVLGRVEHIGCENSGRIRLRISFVNPNTGRESLCWTSSLDEDQIIKLRCV